MKHFITAVLAAFSISMVTTGVQAEESATDSAMMMYFSMPFDGHSRKQVMPTYGFRLDSVDNENITFSSFTGKSAMLDFSMNADGPQSLRFNGVNALVKTTVYNADAGTSQVLTALDWGIVAAGVVGVAVLIKKDEKEDKPDAPVCVPAFQAGFDILRTACVCGCD